MVGINDRRYFWQVLFEECFALHTSWSWNRIVRWVARTIFNGTQNTRPGPARPVEMKKLFEVDLSQRFGLGVSRVWQTFLNQWSQGAPP